MAAVCPRCRGTRMVGRGRGRGRGRGPCPACNAAAGGGICDQRRAGRMSDSEHEQTAAYLDRHVWGPEAIARRQAARGAAQANTPHPKPPTSGR